MYWIKTDQPSGIHIMLHRLLMLCTLLGMQVADAAERVALVIGNGDYEHSAKLRNPANDATDMATALRKLGFEVILRTEANKREMFYAIREFREKLRGSDKLGLFYYAGHGAQHNGINYLLPVTHEVQDAAELEIDAISAQNVLAQMKAAGNPVNIVILDACRNQPFPGADRSDTRGLARMDAISGSLVAYATAPGQLAKDGSGRNGVYTGELLRQMSEPGVGLLELFNSVGLEVSRSTAGRQQPWVSNSALPNIYLAGATPQSTEQPVTPAPSNPSSTVTHANAELLFWQSIASSKLCGDYEAYIGTYPNGQFVKLANNRTKHYCEQKDQGASGLEQSVSTRVTELLRDCAKHLNANHLTTGRDGNALDCYKEVLELTPGNEDALVGVSTIEQRYLSWVERELSQNNPAKAQVFLQRLKTVNPNNSRISNLTQRIAKLSIPSSPTPSSSAITSVSQIQSGNPSSKKPQPYEPEMVSVPAGCFMMGSPPSEEGRWFRERQHRVCVKAFEIGKYEVTQAQWETLMKRNPSSDKGKNKPIENITWRDTQTYIRKLNSRLGSVGSYYRLPTEAEWEFACRSGGKSERYCGGNSLEQLGWHENNSNRTLQDVGQKRSNGLGIHDMSGNVSEWTCSEFDKEYSGGEEICSSRDGLDNNWRLVRGGSFLDSSTQARSASRGKNFLTYYDIHGTGFRLVRTK